MTFEPVVSVFSIQQPEFGCRERRTSAPDHQTVQGSSEEPAVIEVWCLQALPLGLCCTYVARFVAAITAHGDPTTSCQKGFECISLSTWSPEG